jgi:hypothetical protein
MSGFKVGDLVRFCIPTPFWDETEYIREEEEHYGVGLILQKGPEYSFIPEYLVLWTRVKETTWEWGEFLEKVPKEEKDGGSPKKILDSGEEE